MKVLYVILPQNELYEWRFIGRAENGEIVSGNCQKVLITYTSEDVFEEEILYQNGSVKLYFDENGKLCWYDSKENAGVDCRFEKLEAIPYEMSISKRPSK